MVELGWAAAFPIYPSLPRYRDLVLLHEAATVAHTARLGAWAEPLALAGYEYRICVKLYQLTKKLVERPGDVREDERSQWIQRYCVDLTTLEIWEPQQYIRVPPPDRLFIWPKDVKEAVGYLNLRPGGAGGIT